MGWRPGRDRWAEKLRVRSESHWSCPSLWNMCSSLYSGLISKLLIYVEMKKMMNASTSWCMQRRKIAGELQIHNHHRHHLSLLLGTILGQSPLEQQMKGVLTRLNIEQLMGKFETRNANCPWLTVKLVELLWLIQLAWTEVFCSLYLVIICLVKLTLPLLSTSKLWKDPNVNMSWLHVRRGGLCSRLALNHDSNHGPTSPPNLPSSYLLL